jgi:metal-responsive CopG/Arc/MetJ family transcriptional regulator
MKSAKVAITINRGILTKLDRLVMEQVFPSRSKAIQEAVQEKLDRLERGRLSQECAKLDRDFEQTMAEEGFSEGIAEWIEY